MNAPGRRSLTAQTPSAKSAVAIRRACSASSWRVWATKVWIRVQSGTPPGHAKILKSRVKSGKGGRNRRRTEPQSICVSCFVPITCGRNGRGPTLDADPQYKFFVPPPKGAQLAIASVRLLASARQEARWPPVLPSFGSRQRRSGDPCQRARSTRATNKPPPPPKPKGGGKKPLRPTFNRPSGPRR